MKKYLKFSRNNDILQSLREMAITDTEHATCNLDSRKGIIESILAIGSSQQAVSANEQRALINAISFKNNTYINNA